MQGMGHVKFQIASIVSFHVAYVSKCHASDRNPLLFDIPDRAISRWIAVESAEHLAGADSVQPNPVAVVLHVGSSLSRMMLDVVRLDRPSPLTATPA